MEILAWVCHAPIVGLFLYGVVLRARSGVDATLERIGFNQKLLRASAGVRRKDAAGAIGLSELSHTRKQARFAVIIPAITWIVMSAGVSRVTYNRGLVVSYGACTIAGGAFLALFSKQVTQLRRLIRQGSKSVSLAAQIGRYGTADVSKEDLPGLSDRLLSMGSWLYATWIRSILGEHHEAAKRGVRCARAAGSYLVWRYHTDWIRKAGERYISARDVERCVTPLSQWARLEKCIIPNSADPKQALASLLATINKTRDSLATVHEMLTMADRGQRPFDQRAHTRNVAEGEKPLKFIESREIAGKTVTEELYHRRSWLVNQSHSGQCKWIHRSDWRDFESLIGGRDGWKDTEAKTWTTAGIRPIWRVPSRRFCVRFIFVFWFWPGFLVGFERVGKRKLQIDESPDMGPEASKVKP